MGAPLGNKNNAKGKPITDALQRAVAQDNGKRIRAGVEKVLNAFAAGDPWALQFVSDRLDGKPHQTSEVAVKRNDVRDYSTAELAEIIGGTGAVGQEAGAGLAH
jgi:hypothetical protein